MRSTTKSASNQPRREPGPREAAGWLLGSDEVKEPECGHPDLNGVAVCDPVDQQQSSKHIM
jgi:hypothetical protein